LTVGTTKVNDLSIDLPNLLFFDYPDVSFEADQDGCVNGRHDSDVSDGQEVLHGVRVSLVLVVPGDVRKAVSKGTTYYNNL